MDGFVVLGRVTAHFGIKGWVKLQSYTRPPEEIYEFGTLVTADNGSGPLKIRGFRSQGRNLQVAFEGLQSREETEHLIGELVGVDGNSLPALPQGQFYWRDLIGLKVLDSDGRTLGAVQEMMETGANDVAVVSAEERNEEILIPWVEEVITQVDLENGQVMVDWDPDY